MSDDWKDTIAGLLVTTALLTALTVIGIVAVHLYRSIQ